MGCPGVSDAVGVPEQKRRGMHLIDLQQCIGALPKGDQGRTLVGVDVSMSLHKTVNGGITSDLDTAQQIAHTLHLPGSEPGDLPDIVFLAIEEAMLSLIKFCRETLTAEPVMVFDGKAPPAKRALKAQREATCKLAFTNARVATDSKTKLKLYRSAVFVTWEMCQYAMSVLKREGVRYCVALSEADHQLVLMVCVCVRVSVCALPFVPVRLVGHTFRVCVC